MKPIIEVRTNRYYNLIVFAFAAGMGYLFFWLSFISEEPPFEDDMVGRVVLIAFIFISLLICFMALRTFVLNKALFTVYEDGFIANTHGVASHKVLWKDIKRVEKKIVEDRDGKPEVVLAVFFKDPDYFAYSKSKTLGKLIRYGTIARAYAHGDLAETEAPLLIPGISLGKKFDEIKSFMEQQIHL
jgi:hypothetical protein